MCLMDALPDVILEQVLLRLPFLGIVCAKQVCKRWKRVIKSKAFAKSYTSTVKLVAKICRAVGVDETYEIVDSSNMVLRWGGEWDRLGSITSHINGLVITVTGEGYRMGNLFSNKWKMIPAPPGDYFELREAAIFDLGGGRYRLVYWKFDQVEEILMTLESGQKKWSIASQIDTDPQWYTSVVVIGTSLYRAHYGDGILKEFDTDTGQLWFTGITSDSEQVLRFDGHLELIVWKDELYLVLVPLSEFSELHVVEIWRVSTADGVATFVSKLDMEAQIDQFQVREVEDDGVLHLEGLSSCDHQYVISVVYDMVAESVREITCIYTNYTMSKAVIVPVKLA